MTHFFPAQKTIIFTASTSKTKMRMKLRVLAFFFLLPLLAAAQDKLTLTAKIKGLDNDSKVYLLNARMPTDTIGSATVKNEEFVITAELKEPTLMSLLLNNTQNTLIFLENNKVKVSGDIKELPKLKITGSPTNTDFAAMQVIFNPLFDKLTKINQAANIIGRSDSLSRAYFSTRDSVLTATDAFVRKHTETAASAFLMAVTLEMEQDFAATDNRFSQLKPSATQNMYGQYLQQYIDDTKITAIGSVAADFTQADTSGIPISLSSFRGKYVLIDFWASWCGPCRQENPHVVSTYNKFKDKNFTVLGISLDREGQKNKWLDAIHKDNLTWTHVSDLQFWSNAVAVKYKVQSIPQNFLIDPNGRIVAKNLRGPDLEQKLCEILGCN
jgi:peroxiredoxin